MSSWESYLSDSDRAVLEKGKFGRRMGFGARPAVIVIDAQRYMVGEPGRDAEWPSSCGEIGREAVLSSDRWCLAGTLGAELVPELQPGPGDIEFVKKKPSGFHATPLLGFLISRGIDTVIVTGGATSNCIRATVFDASSYNFRTIVPQEAVFDRIPVSHAISLFDMDRQFADVVATEDVLGYLNGIDTP